MRKIDPQLEFLMENEVEDTLGFADETELNRFGIEATRSKTRGKKPKVEVNVLVQYTGEPEELEKAGLIIGTIAGDVVTGKIDLNKLEKLSKMADLERIESSRSMHPELDLSVRDIRANLVHAGPPGRKGAGVIVGIVDTGCDFTHGSFRNSDGSTRILSIWDQGLSKARGENSPTGFNYGVEYSKSNIDAALRTANPFNSVRHQDLGEHGTHVAGIAAGDGSDSGRGLPANSFVGVAPEADIIVVANRSNGGEGLGTSSNTLDAVNYIFRKAAELDKAAVVNMSLGDNLGPHDGTSLLERGLDNLLGRQGRCFVKSAGNAGAARIHAQGNVVTGRTENVRFNQPSGDVWSNQIDMWYEGADRFRISIIDPSGNEVGPVNVGNVGNLTFAGGNRVRIDHRDNDAFNGDKRVFMTFSRGTASSIAAGNWQIKIRSLNSRSGGRFDAWIQRGRIVPSFLSPYQNRSMTISTPGNAREVITAANYSVSGFGAGSLASSSSRGPTRDGRAAPTLAAPGTDIMSANAGSNGDPYQSMSGTSMAAPHVTGTIALMLQKNPDRTQAQIKRCLETSAREDANTGPVPNTAWGAGKLDANAAVNCTPAVIGPIRPIRTVPASGCFRISVPRVVCGTRSVVTACLPPTVITRLCPPKSRVTLCPTKSVVTICPTKSVTTICPTKSRVTLCPTRTIVGPACPTRSVVGPACPTQSIVTPNCPGGGPRESLVRCPSVVDGCPSTPGGCHTDPGGFRRTVIDPGRFRPFNGQFAGQEMSSSHENADGLTEADISALEMESYDDYDYEVESGHYEDLNDQLFAEIEESQSPVPEKGYFDYDDSWFDE